MNRWHLQKVLAVGIAIAIVDSLAVAQNASPDNPDNPNDANGVEVTITAELNPGPDEKVPLMQVALLLDTSNSMDGLINQARAQMWAIVNELAEKKRNGQRPKLEVALFEYGNNRLPATENYVRQVVPLTNDLDMLSESLFALTTDGGSEYCGAVIDEAITVLDWQPGVEHYKAIFIAGNEAFTQGGVEYTQACSRSRAEGVIVNTIHCGNERTGIAGKWRHGALVGGGKFLTIEQDRAIAHIHCPQDEVLLKLNLKLNSTYIPYGDVGREGVRRQERQDANAAGAAPQAIASRVASKAMGNAYRNSRWDLVDALESNEALLEDLDAESLPAELRGKGMAELKQAVADASKKRIEIQKEIAKVASEREAWLAKQRATDADSLGDVIREMVRGQVNGKGFE